MELNYPPGALPPADVGRVTPGKVSASGTLAEGGVMATSADGANDQG